MLYTIPGLIILAFALKGSSLYLAKILMIAVSQEVRRDMQIDMFNSLIIADTQLINKKHFRRLPARPQCWGGPPPQEHLLCEQFILALAISHINGAVGDEWVHGPQGGGSLRRDSLA